MPESTGFILGFDPGGKGRFGWSICSEAGGLLQPCPKTGLADDAWHAICKVKEALPDNPTVLAAGIDAPLFWSTKGNRKIDDVLDKAMRDTDYPPPKNGGRIVQAVNSLRGGCVVQGPLLAKLLSETCWDLKITECHPKVLQWLLPLLGKSDTARMVRHLTAGLVDHELDATLSAVSAWAAIHQKRTEWQNLYEEEVKRQGCPITPFTIPVGY